MPRASIAALAAALPLAARAQEDVAAGAAERLMFWVWFAVGVLLLASLVMILRSGRRRPGDR